MNLLCHFLVQENYSTSRGMKRSATRSIASYFTKSTKIEIHSLPNDIPVIEVLEKQTDNSDKTVSKHPNFVTSEKNDTEPLSPSSTRPDVGDTLSNDSPSCSMCSKCPTSQSPICEVSLPAESKVSTRFKEDIGLYVGKTTIIDDYTKRTLLQDPWQPPNDYSFPFSTHNKQGKVERRYFQKKHLNDHHWLVLSDAHRGLYCKYCVLFASETGGIQSNSVLNTFVKTPLTSFGKLTGKDGALTLHASRKYHMNAVQAGQDFLLNYSKPHLDISNQLCSQRMEQVVENRKRLHPIIETVLLCGRQNISLRGHRDDGKLTVEEPLANDGNFRALLRYRISAGDEILSKHLETTSCKATYISKSTQNELIECCKEEIQNVILSRAKRAGFYAIIFDETTDAAHIEQLSLSLRYTHEGGIREDFLTFLDAYDSIREDDEESNERRLTGVALGHCVVDLLKHFSLPLENCVGIGTDNCSVMASDVKGAVQTIIKSCPNAKRCPCFNHSLNNSLMKTSKVVSIRNTISTMKRIIKFANGSSKRAKLFKNHLGKFFSGLCETRWVEKHDGIIQFQESAHKIVQTLQEITKWKDSSSSSEAFSLIKSMSDADFVVSMACLSEFLSVTRPLSLVLQTPSLDLKNACDALCDTLNVLKSYQSSSDIRFSDLFAKAVKVAYELGAEIQMPRTAVRQTFRENFPASSPEEYYRKAIFVPFLDHLITDLQDRLPEETLKVFNFNLLLPSVVVENTSTENTLANVQNLAELYTCFLGNSTASFLGEFKIWQESWRRRKNEKFPIPQTAIESLQQCNGQLYPGIRLLIQVLATLPVSVATAERSFSTLRRLKTWLRTRMAEERLTGLALLHTHLDIHVDVERIIERFSKMKNRKLEFVL